MNEDKYNWNQLNRLIGKEDVLSNIFIPELRLTIDTALSGAVPTGKELIINDYWSIYVDQESVELLFYAEGDSVVFTIKKG